jgi:hypothetical protein
MKLVQALALFVLLLALTGRVNASPLRVFTFSQPRATTCQDDDWAFATGNAFEDARNAILNPVNFGPAGVVPRNVEFVSDTLITPAALIGADIIFLSVFRDTLDAIEKITVVEFVRQGGGLYFFGNQAAASLAADFGGTAGTVGASCGFTSGAAPPVNGPFGTASGCMSPNYHLNFMSAGPGTVFLSDGAPVGVTYTHESGRAILHCDEEWITDFSVMPPCGVAGNNGSRHTMFMNAIAWVAPSESFEFDPSQVGVPEAPPLTTWTASPNPFADRTTIRLTAQGPIRLTIFDATGRPVRTLDARDPGAITHAFEWDGLSDSARPLPSGMYVFKASAGGAAGVVQTGRLWLIR